MKTLKMQLSILVLLSCLTVTAQNKDSDKLHQHKRDSILTKIAIETVLKYSEGFYRDGAIPTIKYVDAYSSGYISDSEKEYEGKKVYVVSFPLNAEEEEFYGKGEAIVAVITTVDMVPVCISFIDGFGFSIGDGKVKSWGKKKYRSIDQVKLDVKKQYKGTTINDPNDERLYEGLTPEQVWAFKENRRKADSLWKEIQKRDSLKRAKCSQHKKM